MLVSDWAKDLIPILFKNTDTNRLGLSTPAKFALSSCTPVHASECHCVASHPKITML